MGKAYEATFILSPSLTEDERKTEVNWIQSTIRERHGKIVKIDESPRRRFPYEIKKKKEGYFILVNFEIEPQQLSSLNRVYRIREPIIRYMVIVNLAPTEKEQNTETTQTELEAAHPSR